ncbi:MAG: hypothetical protein U0Q12_11495 [Vicinamibacterales bacterium]
MTWLLRKQLIGAACAGLFVVRLAGAQTVDEIVARNLQAKGGADVLRAVTGLRMTGTMVASGDTVPLTIVMKRPNLLRQEMTVQGDRLIQAFDGERAWTVNPLIGARQPRVVGGPQAQAFKDQADFDGPLLNYKDRGIEIVLEGQETYEGRPVHRLRVTRKIGPAQRIDVDVDTGLEVRSVMELDRDGNKLVVENLMSDYRTVAGIQFPHRLRTLVNGQPQTELRIKTIEVSPPIDDELFRRP